VRSVYTCQHCARVRRSHTYGTGMSTGAPSVLSSARFFLVFASSMHSSSSLTSLITSRFFKISSKLTFHVRSSWSTIWLRRPSRVSGAYCAAVGKQDAKFADEHLSSVALEALLKTLIRPWARGPGASATGGAGAGDGDREGGFVAVGMVEYECCGGGGGAC
jgi:hypothetical protein